MQWLPGEYLLRGEFKDNVYCSFVLICLVLDKDSMA